MWKVAAIMDLPVVKIESDISLEKDKQQLNCLQASDTPYLLSSFSVTKPFMTQTNQLNNVKLQNNVSTTSLAKNQSQIYIFSKIKQQQQSQNYQYNLFIRKKYDTSAQQSQPSQNQQSLSIDDQINLLDMQIEDEDIVWEQEGKNERTSKIEQQGANSNKSQLQNQIQYRSDQNNLSCNKPFLIAYEQRKKGQVMQFLLPNQSSSVNSTQPAVQKQRRSSSSHRCLNRKIRTTITRQKLKAINQIFAEYSKQKEEGKNPKLNLKQIGKQLCLGYSTILHKYRQFRSSKCVKGGALIASLQKKRKYKKSLQIQKIIEQALSERPFYTAVELSSYIHKKHAKKFSRSIISRHLGEMGYSYKNITNNPLEKNKPKYKQIRRIYAALMMPIVLSNTTVVYIDELACSLSNFMKRKAGFKVNEGRYSEVESDYISIIVGVSVEGVLYFQVKMGFITRQEFCRTIVKSFQRLRIPDKYNPSIEPLDRPFVITDMNKIHRDLQNGEQIISNTLARFNANRYFLPPISYQLSPLDSIFMNLKHRLWKRDIHHIDELKDLMIRNMNEIMRETTQVYFKDVLINLEKSKMNQNL